MNQFISVKEYISRITITVESPKKYEYLFRWGSVGLDSIKVLLPLHCKHAVTELHIRVQFRLSTPSPNVMADPY